MEGGGDDIPMGGGGCPIPVGGPFGGGDMGGPMGGGPKAAAAAGGTSPLLTHLPNSLLYVNAFSSPKSATTFPEALAKIGLRIPDSREVNPPLQLPRFPWELAWELSSLPLGELRGC